MVSRVVPSSHGTQNDWERLRSSQTRRRRVDPETGRRKRAANADFLWRIPGIPGNPGIPGSACRVVQRICERAAWGDMSGSHEALPVTIGKKSTPGPPTKRPRVDVCAEDNDFAVSSSVASREMKMGADQVKVRIRPEVAKVEQQIVAWRRHFHRHPELSLKEEKTAKFIAGELGRMGIKVLEKQGGYGLVGVLRGAYPGRCIAIRADMDALPIKETVKEDYKSANPGVMHACGHDGHMAILLGAAAVLSKWRQRLRGTLKFVFQPAEEGYGGAKLMIDAGVLDAAPRVDEIYGLHLW